MEQANDSPLAGLVGKRVVFREDAAHAECWHFRVGLKTGVIVKIGQTLAQKAELMGPDSPIPPELLEEEATEPRVWVKVDPCKLFPRGCEAAVERACVEVADEKP